MVGDSSEWEPLPRLKKWVLAQHLDPPNSTTPRKTSDHKYAEFQAKYATWNREYEKMWKHVREMKKTGKDVAGRVTASYIAVKSRELQEMRKAYGLEDAADLARMIYQVRGLSNLPPLCAGNYQPLVSSCFARHWRNTSHFTTSHLLVIMLRPLSSRAPNALACFISQWPYLIRYLQISVDILTHPLTMAMLILNTRTAES